MILNLIVLGVKTGSRSWYTKNCVMTYFGHEVRNNFYCLNCIGNNSSKWYLQNDELKNPSKWIFFKIKSWPGQGLDPKKLGHDPFLSVTRVNDPQHLRVVVVQWLNPSLQIWIHWSWVQIWTLKNSKFLNILCWKIWFLI